MPQCQAHTKGGRRCLNFARHRSSFCSRHSANTEPVKPIGAIVGAIVGHAIAPGLGGLILGALAGDSTRKFLGEWQMTKKRVFVSFDFDNDRVLKDFIIGQARLTDSPFEVIDHSLKEAAPERDWEAKARTAIRRSEIVIVMVGSETHRAPGVLKEIAMAREANVKIVQLIGYRDGNPTPVPNAGRLYAWNWANLKNLLT